MSKKLQGTILLYKQLRRNAIWKREPFTYGQAFVDLIILANDADRTIWIQNSPVDLKRGQLAWSTVKLAEEWQRSRQWVLSFLKYCQEKSMIKVVSNLRGTIITITEYDTYQTADLTGEQAAEQATEQAAEQAQNGEIGNLESGIGKSEVGNGKASKHFREIAIPSEADVMTFGAEWPGDMHRGIPAVIPEAWMLGWFAWRDGANQWPADWRSDLQRRFVGDWLAGNTKARPVKKNGAPVASAGRERGQVLQDLEMACRALEKGGDVDFLRKTREEIERLKKEWARL